MNISTDGLPVEISVIGMFKMKLTEDVALLTKRTSLVFIFDVKVHKKNKHLCSRKLQKVKNMTVCSSSAGINMPMEQKHFLPTTYQIIIRPCTLATPPIRANLAWPCYNKEMLLRATNRTAPMAKPKMCINVIPGAPQLPGTCSLL